MLRSKSYLKVGNFLKLLIVRNGHDGANEGAIEGATKGKGKTS